MNSDVCVYPSFGTRYIQGARVVLKQRFGDSEETIEFRNCNICISECGLVEIQLEDRMLYTHLSNVLVEGVK